MPEQKKWQHLCSHIRPYWVTTGKSSGKQCMCERGLRYHSLTFIRVDYINVWYNMLLLMDNLWLVKNRLHCLGRDCLSVTPLQVFLTLNVGIEAKTSRDGTFSMIPLKDYKLAECRRAYFLASEGYTDYLTCVFLAVKMFPKFLWGPHHIEYA